MKKIATIGDMKNLVKRRMVITSIVLAVWLASSIVLSAREGLASEPSGLFVAISIAVVWAFSLIRNVRLLKDDERLQGAMVARNDERNILITYRATRLAGTIVLCAAAVATICMELLGMQEAADAVAFTICACLIVYLICWYVLAKRG